MSWKAVKLQVDVVFDGDYYDADEVIGVCAVWIDGAFEDRDDVKSWVTSGTVTEES